MQCVCCRCGKYETNATSNLCLRVSDTPETYHSHCFCCAQPPRMKCIYCNTWKELNVLEAHRPCAANSLHMFVHSKPWPPFPNCPPLPPLEAVVVSLDSSQNHNSDVILENENEENILNFSNRDANQNIITKEEPIINEDPEIPSLFESPVQDIKPNVEKTKYDWVSIEEIKKWTRCLRCGLAPKKKTGWLRHVQMCAHDPQYAVKNFFIYLHTKAWCGFLVRDCFWDAHTHPEKGSCGLCRVSRKNNEPLPFQPKPPMRPNQAKIEKALRSRMIIRRKKKREKTQESAILNAGGKDSIQIISCISLN